MKHACSHKKTINFFKAVCSRNRHQILHLLHKKGELNASDIVKKIKLSQPTIAHHLKVLVEAEVLSTRREGKEVFYKINKDNIDNCCYGFASHFCEPKSK